MTTSALLGPPIESDDEDAAQEFEPDDDEDNDHDIEDDDEEEDDDEGKVFALNGGLMSIFFSLNSDLTCGARFPLAKTMMVRMMRMMIHLQRN